MTDEPQPRTPTAKPPQGVRATGARQVQLTQTNGTWKRNLVFVWIGVFVGLLGANFVFPFIPFFLRDLGVETESDRAFWTGISASVTGLSLTITSPIWGSMADRFGRKPMFLRALAGAGVLIALMGLAQVLWHFVLLRFLMGAFAGTMGAAAALVAASTPREKVGYALGMLQTGQFAANMIGPAVGGYVAAGLGIRESFFFCAALYGIAVLLVWVFVKERPPQEDGEQETVPARPRSEGSLIDNLRVVIRERQVVLMLILLFALWLSTTFVRPVMPLSIDDFAGYSGRPNQISLDIGPVHRFMREEAATGLVFAAVGLTSTLSALFVAPIGQRIGYKRSVAGAALITGILFIPVALATSFGGFLLLFAATGLFQGAMVPGTNALIAAATPEGKHGSTFGLAASMQSLALLVGPAAGGAVGALFGIHSVYLVIAVILLATAVAAQLFIREPDVFRRK